MLCVRASQNKRAHLHGLHAKHSILGHEPLSVLAAVRGPCDARFSASHIFFSLLTLFEVHKMPINVSA